MVVYVARVFAMRRGYTTGKLQRCEFNSFHSTQAGAVAEINRQLHSTFPAKKAEFDAMAAEARATKNWRTVEAKFDGRHFGMPPDSQKDLFTLTSSKGDQCGFDASITLDFRLSMHANYDTVRVHTSCASVNP
jgi:hypothetical protein